MEYMGTTTSTAACLDCGFTLGSFYCLSCSFFKLKFKVDRK
jgi:hypothetical protein